MCIRDSSDLDRIVRLSTWLHRAATALLIVLPVVFVVFLLRWALNPDDLIGYFPGVTTQVSSMTAVIVTLLGALSLPPLLVALAQMRRLFGRYRRAEILSAACAGHVQVIGHMLVALAVLAIVGPTLQVLALSWQNPPGQRILQIGLSDQTLGFLLAGAFLSVVGWVMREAARIKAENEGFV